MPVNAAEQRPSEQGTELAWLDTARILAILAVVLLHVSAAVVIQCPPGTVHWWIGNLVDSTTRWCVPVFVMISGALLLDPGRQETAATFYRKRAARIAIPLLFWTVFYLLWAMLKGIRSGHPPLPGELAERVLAGVPHYHMWFLYMILPLYLVTPFLRRLVRATDRRVFGTATVSLLALAAGVTAIGYPEPVGRGSFLTLFLYYIPWFLLGYMLRTMQGDVSRTRTVPLALLTMATTAAGVHLLTLRLGLDSGLYFYDYLSITVILMSLAMALFFRSLAWVPGTPALSRRLARLTLGVYLVHPVPLELLQHAGLDPLNVHPGIYIPTAFLLATGLSAVGVLVLQRIPILARVV